MPTLFAIVASGFAVSGDIDLRKHILEAIAVPTITSADLLVQAGFDTTSALFTRVLEPHGAVASGDLRMATGLGSRTVSYPRDAFTPPYMRLETAVTQTDNRTLSLLTRARAAY